MENLMGDLETGGREEGVPGETGRFWQNSMKNMKKLIRRGEKVGCVPGTQSKGKGGGE